MSFCVGNDMNIFHVQCEDSSEIRVTMSRIIRINPAAISKDITVNADSDRALSFGPSFFPVVLRTATSGAV